MRHQLQRGKYAIKQQRKERHEEKLSAGAMDRKQLMASRVTLTRKVIDREAPESRRRGVAQEDLPWEDMATRPAFAPSAPYRGIYGKFRNAPTKVQPTVLRGKRVPPIMP